MTVIHAAVERSLASVLADMGLGAVPARLVPCPRPEMGDAAVQAALAGARILKRPPMAIAAEIADGLRGHPAVASAEPVPPGYVNVRFAGPALAEALAAQVADAHGGVVQAGKPEKIIIDFGGPNVAKSMHVGHLRSLVIGESLRRILIAQGHEVVSDIHLGDWGLQMGQLLSEARLRMPDLPFFTGTGPYPEGCPFDVTDLEGMYKAASLACKESAERLTQARADTAALQAGDPGLTALWRSMRAVSLESVRADIERLDAHFDLWDGESDAHPLIAPMIDDLHERGLTVEDQGALVAFVNKEGDKKQFPPVILLKSDGAALYATTDLATLRDRVERMGADRIIYCADQRQEAHFEGVFRLARKASYAADTRLDFVGFGTVNGPDGRPYKTREGGVMPLSSLLGQALAASWQRTLASEHASTLSEEAQERLSVATAIGAVKFADLSSVRTTGYAFDVDRLLAAEGRTGPYLQYACARVRSVLDKASVVGVEPSGLSVDAPEERALANACLAYPDAVAEASQTLQPHLVAERAFIVAQAFSAFYAACPILAAGDPPVMAGRLGLAAAALGVLERSLGLLGIEVPERM